MIIKNASKKKEKTFDVVNLYFGFIVDILCREKCIYICCHEEAEGQTETRGMYILSILLSNYICLFISPIHNAVVCKL